MNAALRNRQLGVSVWAILGIVIAVVVAFWLIIKVVPEFMVANTVNTCLQDSYASGSGKYDRIKERFESCLTTNALNDMTALPGKIKMRGKFAVLEWDSKLPIMGNASLLLEFSLEAPEE